ncbi:MAG: hypothetical protein WCP28_19830 [Actinomycetes bacterium]
MKRLRLARAAAVTLVGGVLAVTAALPAFAADATGCTGAAMSRDAQGRELDHVLAPGPGGTADNPFRVNLDGTVDWTGETTSAIRNGTWKVTVGSLPASGSFTNEAGQRAGSGSVKVGDKIPGLLGVFFRGNQKMLVDVSITGSGGSCTASVWIQNSGGAAFTPMWFTGVGAAALGVVGLAAMLFGTKATGLAAGAYPGVPPTGPPPYGMPPGSYGPGA